MAYLDDIRAALLAQCPDILQRWFGGNGRLSRHEFCIGDLAGNPGDSLKVNIKTGRWSDFATGDKGGDLIGLYAKIKSIPYKKKDTAPGEPYAIDVLAQEMGIAKPVMPKGDWSVVCPVPENAYSCDSEGNPILPDVPAVAHHSRFWTYFDADGRLLNFRFRIEKSDGGKDVKPLSYCRERHSGECRWMSRDLPDPIPLYGLMELASQPEKVLVCEGEKATDAARTLLDGWCIATWPGGSKRVKSADWGPVRALPATSRIFLWPDRDIPGEQAMSDVRDCLQRPVEIIRTDPKWPEGWDIYDLKEQGWTGERVEKYLYENSLPQIAEKPKPRPEIELTGKDYRHQAEAIFRAMEEVHADVYKVPTGVSMIQRGAYGQHELRNLNPQTFAAWCNWNLSLFAYNGNGRHPVGLPEVVSTTCLVNADGQLPRLRRVADIPVYSGTGELIETSGYNRDCQTYISIPPGYRSDMGQEEAWELIGDLLADFPFETESDRAAAIAYPLTAILRNRINGPTPMFRFEAPKGGTGKSLLCRILTAIITPYPVEYPMPAEEAETEKLLVSLLRSAPAAIIFDNAEKIDSPSLKRALTCTIFGGRILGESETVGLPVLNVWALTSNNPTFGAEIFDRTVRVRLNAKMENPRARDAGAFRHADLDVYVQRNRGALVSAFVALAREAKDYASQTVPRIGTYEEWIKAVHPVLELNGYEDVTATRNLDAKLTADSKAQAAIEFIEAWKERYGRTQATAKELAQVAVGIDGLDVYRSKKTGDVSSASVGRWMQRNRDNVISGAMIVGPEHTESGNTYRLQGDFQTKSSIPEQSNWGEKDGF